MRYIILGLGITGLSVLRYLLSLPNVKPTDLIILDTREEPPQKQDFCVNFPNIASAFGNLVLEDYLLPNIANNMLIISPGLRLELPIIKAARNMGVKISSDIGLFLAYLKNSKNIKNIKIVGITGSNGKSTVTALVGFLLTAQGLKVAVGGNIGTPALDLLTENYDYYVLELSSFQLELLSLNNTNLSLDVACYLNLSPDHMDRYANITEYYQAKHYIYHNAAKIVYNAEDALLISNLPPEVNIDNRYGFSFSLQDGCIKWPEFKLLGKHNVANLLASIAIIQALDLAFSDKMQSALINFTGLAHRCEYVKKYQDIVFINDSKATNVGATLACLDGLAGSIKGKWVLILGGDAKAADLSPLKELICQLAKVCILIGKDAQAFLELLNKDILCVRVDSMLNAVKQSLQYAEPGDGVLLAPACASTDMFKNFEDRGNQFKQAVLQLTAG